MARPVPPQHQALRDFLNARIKRGDERATHVGGKAGGSWIIRDTELDTFHRLYADALACSAPVHVIEVCREDANMPLIVDLDIKGPQPESGRLYDPVVQHLPAIVSTLNGVYREMLEIHEDYFVHVLARPVPYLNDKGLWSDGIHIQSKTLFTSAWNHQACRVEVLERLPEDVRRLLEPIWDVKPLQPSGAGTLFMFGSTKPRELLMPATPRAYEHFNTFECSVDAARWRYLAFMDPEADDKLRVIQELAIRPGRPVLRLREGVLPCGSEVSLVALNQGGASSTEEVVATSTEEVGVSPEVSVSPEAWADALDLVSMLSEARAVEWGIKAGEGKGSQGVIQVIAALHFISGGSEAGKEAALAFARRSPKHWGTPAAAAQSLRWFHSPTGPWASAYKFRKDMRALRTWAKEDSPEKYKAFKSRVVPDKVGPAAPKTPEEVVRVVNEITTLDTQGIELVLNEEGGAFHHRYIYGSPPLAGISRLAAFAPVGVRSTLAISSHLGTGKTTLNKALANAMKDGSPVYPTILYISGRITFTQQQMAEWGQECGFVSYQGLDKPFTVAKHPRLFIQTESLFHLMIDEGLPDLTHSLVILDEMATILKSLVPGKTQKHNLVNNLKVFDHVVQRASTVIAGDAFLHNREMDVLRGVRPDVPLRLLHNTFNPYSHRTFQQVKIMGRSKDKKEDVEKVKAGRLEFFGRIIKDLKAGRRVVLVLGSKKAGLAFEKVLKEEFKTPDGGLTIDYRFYHGESDEGVKASDLADVDTAWSKLHLLMYTPTITVGVNYDPKTPVAHPPLQSKIFQRLYIYGTRQGPSPRDIAQASLRCRDISPFVEGEPHMVFYLDHRGGGAPYAGFAAVEKRLTLMRHNNVAAALRAVGLQEMSSREERQGWAFFKPDGIKQVPAWFNTLFINNINETNVSASFPKEVYARYIERLGYSSCEVEVAFDGEPPALPKDAPVPSYWDILDIKSKAEDIKKKQDRGERITPEERLQMTKVYFKRAFMIEPNSFKIPNPAHMDVATLKVFDDNHPEWFKDRDLVDALWRGVGPCPDGCEEKHHKATCVKDCTAPHKHSISGYKGGYLANFGVWKTISLAKMDTFPQTLSACAALDYLEGGGSYLNPQSLAAKAMVMNQVCFFMGIDHPGVPKVWTSSEWKDVMKEFRTVRTWDDLPEDHDQRTSCLEDRVIVAFNKRDRSKAPEEGGHSDVEHLKKTLSNAFESWCLSSLQVSYVCNTGTSKQKEAARDFPEGHLGYKNYNAYKAAMVKSPERKAAAEAKGASTPEDIKAAITSEVEEEFPKHNRYHGVHLVPWENKVKGDVGLLWSLVPGFQPGMKDFKGILEIQMEDDEEDHE